MSGYAKLFSEIVDSSIWEEDSDTCKVWITLLALADQDGYVRGSDGWLAGKSRVSLGKCISALNKFKESDVRSRTPDNDGKRIEQLEDGWLILNYISFRDRLSSDPQAVATRERVRKHRERYKALRNDQSVTAVTAAVPASASVQGNGECEGKGKFKAPTLEQLKLLFAKSGGSESEAVKFFNHYSSNGWKVGKNKMVSVPHAVGSWMARRREGQFKATHSETPTNCI